MDRADFGRDGPCDVRPKQGGRSLLWSLMPPMESYASTHFCAWPSQDPSQQRLRRSWWRREFPPASSLTCCLSHPSSPSCWTQGRSRDHPKGKKLSALREGAGELLEEQGGGWAKPLKPKEDLRDKGLVRGKVGNAVIFWSCSWGRRG